MSSWDGGRDIDSLIFHLESRAEFLWISTVVLTWMDHRIPWQAAKCHYWLSSQGCFQQGPSVNQGSEEGRSSLTQTEQRGGGKLSWFGLANTIFYPWAPDPGDHTSSFFGFQDLWSLCLNWRSVTLPASEVFRPSNLSLPMSSASLDDDLSDITLWDCSISIACELVINPFLFIVAESTSVYWHPHSPVSTLGSISLGEP